MTSNHIFCKPGRHHSVSPYLRFALLTTSALVALGVSVDLAMAQVVIDNGNVEDVPGTQASPWNVAPYLIVGDTSAGTLNISAGGKVNGQSAEIGSHGGSAGIVTIDGSGSRWASTNDIRIGYEGVGSVSVSNGGLFNANGISLGVVAGSSGTVTIDGIGSTWNAGSFVLIGEYGNGTLAVSGGAHATVSGAVIALEATSQANVAIAGPGSLWSIVNNLVVSDSGTGSLVVSNGGAITDTNGVISQFGTGRGTATVTGAGSTWTNSADLRVGDQGVGALTIADGGQVSDVNGFIGYNGVVTGIGSMATVTGAGSTWTNTGDLTVAVVGSAALNVADGGHVLANSGYLAGNAGSSGGLAVDGSGSLVSLTNELYVGYLDFGSLAISNGGAVNDANGIVGFGGSSISSARVDGTGSVWANTANTRVGYFGSGILDVTGGGAVTDTNGWIGDQAGSLGVVTVDGTGSTWSNTSDLQVGSSGNGSLTVSGGGLVSVGGVLTVATNAGSTGALNIGAAAGSPAATSGTITAPSIQFGAGDGSINFNHTETAYNFASSLTGAGTVNQLAGNTILTGSSSGFTGQTNVLGGRLAVNGSLENSMVTVGSGGILGGNGIVGGINASSGGMIGPGNSIGTLTVNGNIMQAAGSVYQVEVTSAGQSDLLHATGTATIADGALLDIVKLDAAPYVVGTQYTVLRADGGVTGTYAFAGPSTFLGLNASYDATHVYVNVTQAKSFASVGITPNQIATGTGVASLGSGALYNAVLTSPTDEAAQNAFDQLSGEVHASLKGALVDDSRFPREAALDRLRTSLRGNAEASGTHPVVWGHGFGSWGQWNGDGNAATYNRSTGGFVAGTEGDVLEKLRLGVFVGYGNTQFDAGSRASSGSSDTYHVGLYAGTNWGDLAFRSGLAYGWHNVTTTRQVSIAGFADTLTARYGSATSQAFGELAYGLDVGPAEFEPFANLAYVNVRTDGFAEQGGAAALTNSGSLVDATFTTLGLRASTKFALGSVNTTLKASLGWRHAFGDPTPKASMSLGGGQPFTIAGVPIPQDTAVLDVGLDLDIGSSAALGISYGGQFGSGQNDQTIRASFSAKF